MATSNPSLSIVTTAATSSDINSFVVGESGANKAVFFKFTSTIVQDSIEIVCPNPPQIHDIQPTKYSDYYIGICNISNPKQVIAFSRTKAAVNLDAGEFQGVQIVTIFDSKMIALFGGAGAILHRAAYVLEFPEYYGCTSNCDKCSNLNISTSCTSCKSGYKDTKSNGTCTDHLMLIESKKFRLEPKLLDKIGYDIKQRVEPSNPNANSFKYPENFFKVEMLKDPTGGTGKEIKASTLKDIDGNISIYILLKNYKNGSYDLQVTATDPSVGLEGKVNITVEKFGLESQKKEAERSGDVARVSSRITTYIVMGTTVLSAVLDSTFENLSADSSLIKFTMLLKMINRLRFVNVHHGLALDTFFGKMEDISSPLVGINFDRI